MNNQEESKLFDIAIITIIVNLSIIPAIIIFASVLNNQSEDQKQNQDQVYKYPFAIRIQ